MCDARSGCVAKRRAVFVRQPVATSHAVPLGWAIRAEYIASMAVVSVLSGTVGEGRQVVPSRPDSPWMSGAAAGALQKGRAAPG